MQYHLELKTIIIQISIKNTVFYYKENQQNFLYWKTAKFIFDLIDIRLYAIIIKKKNMHLQISDRD